MPGLAVREGERAADRALLPERDRLEESERPLDVGEVEERQRRLVLRQLLPVEVLGVFFLQVRGVLEEDLGELTRRRRAVDRPGEALPHEPRHTPDVVEVRVGEDHGRDRAGVELRVGPVAQAQGLLALEHPGVDEEARAPGLEQVLRSRHRPRRPEERQSCHTPVSLWQKRPTGVWQGRRSPRTKKAATASWVARGSYPAASSPGTCVREKIRSRQLADRGSCPAPSRLLSRAAVKGRWNAVSPSTSSAAPCAGSRRSCSSGCRPACRGVRAR